MWIKSWIIIGRLFWWVQQEWRDIQIFETWGWSGGSRTNEWDRLRNFGFLKIYGLRINRNARIVYWYRERNLTT
jgi:hypothetical protein